VDVAGTPGADEDDAAAPAKETPPFVGAGVADAAAGRERRLAAGLREFEGRAGAAAAAVAAYAAGAEIGCWWEVVERRDSVGEAARSGLSGCLSVKRGEGGVLVGGVEERTFLSERRCVSAGWCWRLRPCLSLVSCLPLDQRRPPVDQGVFSCWTSCFGRPSSRAWRRVGDGRSRTWIWGRRSGGQCAGRMCGGRGWRG
jgi:hypothetical protein